MAHLNVQAHRIEAKIAYVGPEGVATTFARLKGEAGISVRSDFALEWRPARRFRDCDVIVQVVTGKEDVLADLVKDADGVIFVGDATEEKSRAYFDSIRDRLVTGTPLLVQEQAVGTLENALEEVLAKLETAAPVAAKNGADATHPLLDALRGVLRDTVREHVEELAARMLETRRADDAVFLHVVQALEETDTQLRQLRDAISSTAHSVDAVTLRAQRFDLWMKRIEKLEESTTTIHTKLGELIEELKKPRKGWFT